MENLFIFPGGKARALADGDIPALQAFFEANPDYFLAVNGQLPNADEAHDVLHDDVPADMPYTLRWTIGFADDAGHLIGIASVVSDLLAPQVWHIGLFVIATSLHGRGIAAQIHEHLEAWMRTQGARWIRLGVVEGNARAERFWEKAGYIEARKRGPVEMGMRANLLRVMMKPLDGATREEYLAQVARDRPE